MQYYFMLGVLFLVLCVSVYNTKILFDQKTNNKKQTELVSNITSQTRIEILEKMYNEIEERKNTVKNNPDEILGNDNHIIMNGYYQTQIFIIHEIKNQIEDDGGTIYE